MTARTLVLVSGGLDSAVALWWAKEHAPGEVVGLTFDYPGRPGQERDAATALAGAASVPLRSVELPFLREAAEVTADGVDARALRDAPDGYVPARNIVFYGIALHVAESIGATRIVGGHNAEDGSVFPDATRAFFDGLTRLAHDAVWSFQRQPLRIDLPLHALDKRGVVALGLRLGVPFHLTWSCYEDGDGACGVCRSCIDRAEAFAAVAGSL